MRLRTINLLLCILFLINSMCVNVFATTFEFSEGITKRQEGLYVKYKGTEKYIGEAITKDDISVIYISADKKVAFIKDWECATLLSPLEKGDNIFKISYKGYIEKLVITAIEKPVEPAESVEPAIKTRSTISVKPVSQLPELPTGCEITALTTVFNFYGYAVGKCTMADEFLEKGPVNATDFRVAFVGNPRSKHAYGCYAPVIVKAARKYIAFAKSSLKVEDITGRELEDLFTCIDQGIPVIVWGTINCSKGYYTNSWYANGRKITWFANEHCMVLTGYDRQKGVVYVSDPWLGVIKEYNLSVFKDRYNSLGKQAVVIHK